MLGPVSMRVAITGRGAIAPIGVSVGELCNGLLIGRIGIRVAPWAAASGNDGELFAAVDDRFDPADWLDDKVIEGCDPFAWFALAAAEQAITEAGLLGHLDPRRTADIVQPLPRWIHLKRAKRNEQFSF